ncbi:hypothetical protein AVEN_118659-1 [Araneus ventricosus]|uniref:Uncharacterized protein n=1 Tax=Araneus ventricosus TaxID=182803 RepID=A0A4Y2AZJ1_ARAVE|nr:hypothetical protein AVEN_118659-1 [Araneus ventricosus]
MLSFVTIAIVLNLAVSGIAQESDGPPERENVFIKLFPACEPFVRAFENQAIDFVRKDEIGPESCADEEYYEGACLENDAKKTRCAVPEMPSEECMAQMTAFMQGDVCNLR